MGAPESVLAELARVVRPSGLIAVQVWAAGGLVVPRLFREAAATVGVEMVDPNVALGEADLLITALASAGLGRNTVREMTWRQPLPAPDDAWAGILASAVGGPVRDLDEEPRRSARREFITAMTKELESSSVDVQSLPIAIGARS